ncbi:hypothetical protein GEMRC1_013243 [Eukaryota sp. GEM-RC1]
MCPLFDVIKECSTINSDFSPRLCFHLSFSTRIVLARWDLLHLLADVDLRKELMFLMLSDHVSLIKNAIYFALQRFIGGNNTKADAILHCIHAGVSWDLITKNDLILLVLLSHYYGKASVNGIEKVLSNLDSNLRIIPDDVQNPHDISALIQLVLPNASTLLRGGCVLSLQSTVDNVTQRKVSDGKPAKKFTESRSMGGRIGKWLGILLDLK